MLAHKLDKDCNKATTPMPARERSDPGSTSQTGERFPDLRATNGAASQRCPARHMTKCRNVERSYTSTARNRVCVCFRAAGPQKTKGRRSSAAVTVPSGTRSLRSYVKAADKSTWLFSFTGRNFRSWTADSDLCRRHWGPPSSPASLQ